MKCNVVQTILRYVISYVDAKELTQFSLIPTLCILCEGHACFTSLRDQVRKKRGSMLRYYPIVHSNKHKISHKIFNEMRKDT